MVYLVIILAVIFLLVVIRFMKRPKTSSLNLYSGALGAGKSSSSLYFAIREYKKQRRKWKLKRIFKKDIEEPLLYSNVPLANIKYVPLTEDLLQRNTRFNYKSVCYMQETSLIADSQMYKDQFLNEKLLLFVKLFRHETRGGSVFMDTQSISDNHYAFKRCISQYIYIHHSLNVFGLFRIIWCREMMYSEDGSSVNTSDEDLEESLVWYIVPCSIFKKYDSYCYSVLTDDNPIENITKMNVSKTFARANLKTKKIVSFKKYKTLEEKENV